MLNACILCGRGDGTHSDVCPRRKPLCWECHTPVEDVDLVYDVNPYHWACLQESYERDRLADEADEHG